jgi:hypothetical protein
MLHTFIIPALLLVAIVFITDNAISEEKTSDGNVITIEQSIGVIGAYADVIDTKMETELGGAKHILKKMDKIDGLIKDIESFIIGQQQIDNNNLAKLSEQKVFYKDNKGLSSYLEWAEKDLSKKLAIRYKKLLGKNKKLLSQIAIFKSAALVGSVADLYGLKVSVDNLVKDINDENVKYAQSVLPVLVNSMALIPNLAGMIGAAVGNIMDNTDKALTLSREATDVYSTGAYNIRDEYFSQYNHIADMIAKGANKDKVKERIKYYSTRRTQMKKDLDLIYEGLNSSTLPLIGAKALKKRIRDVYLMLDDNSIEQKMSAFATRYTERYESRKLLIEEKSKYENIKKVSTEDLPNYDVFVQEVYSEFIVPDNDPPSNKNKSIYPESADGSDDLLNDINDSNKVDEASGSGLSADEYTASLTYTGVVWSGSESGYTTTSPYIGMEIDSFNAGKVSISTLTNNDDSGYQYSYTSWGEWEKAESNSFASGGEYNGHWIAGVKSTDIPKTGSATYSGTIEGKSANVQNLSIVNGESFIDSSNVPTDSITGTVSLNANFANDSLSGSMDIYKDGASWDNPSLTNGTINNGSFSSQLSGAGSGSLIGNFFGKSGQTPAEAGGAWSHSKEGEYAVGIFRARRMPTGSVGANDSPVDTSNLPQGNE